MNIWKSIGNHMKFSEIKHRNNLLTTNDVLFLAIHTFREHLSFREFILLVLVTVKLSYNDLTRKHLLTNVCIPLVKETLHQCPSGSEWYQWNRGNRGRLNFFNALTFKLCVLLPLQLTRWHTTCSSSKRAFMREL